MTQVSPQTPPPAPGWYVHGANAQRYWDGTAWTDNVAPLAAPYWKPTNHVFHLIMSIVTVGLWVPVWIIVAISNQPPRPPR